MKGCPQTDKINVLEHGQSVWKYFKKLFHKEWDGLKIPSWLNDNYEKIISNLHDLDIIERYNVYHDCGKPYCLEYDSLGKRHYPNHANISFEVWKNLFPNDVIVSNLIKEDMSLHTLTSDEILLKNWNIKDSMTLLLTSLAELHANAEMFGGIESDSFKIKYKKIDKRGKMICRKFLKI